MSPHLALLPPVRPALSGPKSPFGPRVFAALALLSALLVLPGCGTVVDKVKLQDTVQASLEDSIREKIKAVECPSDQPVEPGATFTCDVIFSDDRREEAVLKIRNEKADISMVRLQPKN